ncbi:MAG: PEP-CTERM sorting domain-containing protein, partial [Phycisphaerae bacterium]|nr:PEP-CTERM sorting domain-containing protein [Phycisphaerae bacterium]
LLKQGTSSYERLDGIGRNRWGDYSATVVDPDDPMVFWTFQEWASGEDAWSLQVTQIIVPEPATFVFLAAGLLVVAIRRRR